MNLAHGNQGTPVNPMKNLFCMNFLQVKDCKLMVSGLQVSLAWLVGLCLLFIGCSSTSNKEAPGRIPGTPIVQSAPGNAPKAEDLAPAGKTVSEKTSNTPGIQKFSAAHPFSNDVQEYKLQVEDEIEVKFHLVPELNERVKVRPDGKISLQIIDEVEVLGLAPSELDRLLTKRYAKTLREPDLTVIVRQFTGQKVFVGGEVNSQGMIPIHGRLTVTQAIMQAGGFKDSAELENVVLLRNQGKKDPYFAILNLHENLNDPMGGMATTGVMLQPYDVVYVPKSTIATINQFVDQYINKIVPQSFQWGFQWLSNMGAAATF